MRSINRMAVSARGVRLIGGLALLLLGTSQLAIAQRRGGEIRRRTDDRGAEYFEVFADHTRGNHAYPAPMRADASSRKWPSKVTIRAESTWMIAPGTAVDANGRSAETCGSHGASCPGPNLPWGALLGRWVSVDAMDPFDLLSGSPRTKALTGWLKIGKQAMLDVPIPSRVSPSPYNPAGLAALSGLSGRAEFHYTPLVALQFVCNDASSEYYDNDGWLHVYQGWTW